MTTHETYDHPILPLTFDYDYDTGEAETGIPSSVEITAVWFNKTDIMTILQALCPDWIARMEDSIKQTKLLF
jgi:hypothetical protein